MMDFRTVRPQLPEIAERWRSPIDVGPRGVQAALDRIERFDGELGAFVAVDGEAALAEAAAIDARIAGGEDVGPLAGVPLAVKDLEDAAGFVTSRGSAAFAGGPPRPPTRRWWSASRRRLRGRRKTNTPEFGWKPDTVNDDVRGHAQPLVARPVGGWLVRRLGGGAGGGPRPAGHRVRRRRLDPHPVLGHGADRAQAVARAGAERRAGAARLAQAVHPGLMTRGARDLALALDAVVGPRADGPRVAAPARVVVVAVAGRPQPAPAGWHGRPPSATPSPTPRSWRCARRRSHGSRQLGTEVVVVDEVFAADPVDEWLTLVGSLSLRSLDRSATTPPCGSGSIPGWPRSSSTPEGGVSGRQFAGPRRLPPAERAGSSTCSTGSRLLLTPTVAGQLPVDGQGTIDGEPDDNWVRYTYPFNMTRSPAGSVCAGFTADGMPVGPAGRRPPARRRGGAAGLALLEDLLGPAPYGPVGIAALFGRGARGRRLG